MSQLESLMKDHFIEYASYFILDRAIPVSYTHLTLPTKA